MHWLDIIILIVLGLGAVFGFWSGLLWQIARIVSLALSLYVAITVNTPLAEWLEHQWRDTSPTICRVGAFVLAFILVYLILYLITRMVHQAIKATKLEMVDRMLGALLGMAKMGAIVSGVCAALIALDLQMTRGWVEQSMLAAPFAHGTDVVLGLIPHSYRDRLDENVQQAKDQLQKKAAEEFEKATFGQK
jgi:membrane protein required for colicin V production